MTTNKIEILKKVKNKELTAQEGAELFQKLLALPAKKQPQENNYSKIAVIGMSGQIPQAKDINQMWEVLSNGKDVVGEVPTSRWQSADQDENHWGGFMSDIDCFDPLFFQISPKEAEQMDPQQRILLQESWKAFEDAGYSMESLDQKSCCVMMGCTQGDYLSEAESDDINPHSLTGRSISVLAARISYFFNFRGPSIAVNTACSSSLISFVLACEKLANRTCDLGLVGGISLMSTQTSHVTMGKVGMISPNGKCYTFDQRANGIVPGEAVGVVVLKRLDEALRDGNQIYGVIEGYGCNHDGKTNGLTAPSGSAQTSLLLDIYRRFGIDASTISYIEAHGTGTKLGDPIEVHALSDAFKKYNVAQKKCAIGSIKTNIGHTLEASGIMGAIKVLLCLRHQKLVPSLNFEQPNQHISFSQSPFYVNTDLKNWDVQENALRRAGVSSFGMSGTNAHIVFAQAPKVRNMDEFEVGFFPISAKTPIALAQKVEDLKQWIDIHKENLPLSNIAYTLQTGRTHFEYRYAVIASNRDEFISQLSQFDKGTQILADPSSVIESWEKVQANFNLARKDNQREQLQMMADIYEQGASLDWAIFYQGKQPRHVSLPFYPFAQERYWLDMAKKSNAQCAYLHPLVQKNTSCLLQQRFTSHFNGNEFFLADHCVESPERNKVLPGVVYLEMARVAVLLSLDSPKENIRFKDVSWLQPIIANKPITVHIRVSQKKSQELYFEIYTGEDVVHCQGVIQTRDYSTATKLGLPKIKRQMTDTITTGECYRQLQATGVFHGESLQGVTAVKCDERQLIAELELPAVISETLQDYVLHPTMMDAAIQATIAFNMRQSSTNPYMPFAIDEVEILGECFPKMISRACYSKDSNARVKKIDIDICDTDGNVCVRITGLASRAASSASSPSTKHDVPLHSLTPTWNALSDKVVRAIVPNAKKKLLVIGATTQEKNIKQVFPHAQFIHFPFDITQEEIGDKLQHIDFDHLVWVAPTNKKMTPSFAAKEQKKGVLQVFRILKALLALGYGEKSLEWTVLTFQTQFVTCDDIVDPTYAAVHGLIGSMAKEYLHWKVRLIDLDYAQWPVAQMFSISPQKGGNALAIRRGNNGRAEWFQQKLIHINMPQMPKVSAYKNEGIYIVVGGAGGLGEVWSRFMIERYQAKIIWLGRRKKDSGIENKIQAISTSNIKYIQVNAGNLEALQKAYREIKNTYSRIDGIVHSAIVLQDQSIAKMTESRFASSLVAKIDVSLHLV